MEYKQKRYSTHALFNNQFIYKYIYTSQITIQPMNE